MKTSAWVGLVSLCALGAAAAAPASAGPSSALASRLHADAVKLFRAGRFPEAYGRFVQLAEAGHPASARYALWMCEHGLPLFGSDWDCAPHEIEDWTRTARSLPAAPAPRTALTGSRLRTADRR